MSNSTSSFSTWNRIAFEIMTSKWRYVHGDIFRSCRCPCNRDVGLDSVSQTKFSGVILGALQYLTQPLAATPECCVCPAGLLSDLQGTQKGLRKLYIPG